MTKKEVSNDEIMSTLAQFADKVDKRFESTSDEILSTLAQFADSVDKRFDKFEMGQMRLESRMETLDHDMVNLKASHDRLLSTVDKFIARIDTYETEQAMRDNQFQRLLDWARKVSEKTGIPLENL